MQDNRFLGRNGFYWFFGVVEDRNDPLRMGRVRVRIIGYHTENKNDLPTEDLPWASPILPITAASISGVGSAPIGPIEGTRVFGFFIDGESAQIPMILGSLPGVRVSAVDLSEGFSDPSGTYPIVPEPDYTEGSPVPDNSHFIGTSNDEVNYINELDSLQADLIGISDLAKTELQNLNGASYVSSGIQESINLIDGMLNSGTQTNLAQLVTTLNNVSGVNSNLTGFNEILTTQALVGEAINKINGSGNFTDNLYSAKSILGRFTVFTPTVDKINKVEAVKTELIQFNQSFVGVSQFSTIPMTPIIDAALKAISVGGTSVSDLIAMYNTVNANVMTAYNQVTTMKQSIPTQISNSNITTLLGLANNMIGKVQMPVDGSIITNYGLRKNPLSQQVISFHKGVDIEAPTGTMINAVDTGVVTFAGNYESYGNLVVIKHKNGTAARYGLLGSILVSVNDIVGKGQVIGTAGTNNLHLELRANELLDDNVPSIDPTPILTGSSVVETIEWN